MNNENTFLSSFIIFISILLLVLINYSIFYIPNLMWVMPWLSTVGVFFWVVFAKKEFTFGQAFTIGIIEDIVVGSTLGFHAFILIVLYKTARQQRKYLAGKPFTVIWFAYTISLIFIFTIAFLLNYILGNTTSIIAPLNWLITVLIFPIFYLALLYIRNNWIKK